MKTEKQLSEQIEELDAEWRRICNEIDALQEKKAKAYSDLMVTYDELTKLRALTGKS